MHPKKGFTFIEVILSVAIISILSMSSGVFYARFFNQNAVSNTTDQLVESLRKAQFYSMMERKNGKWGVHFAANTITVYQVSGANTWATRTTALDEKFSVNSSVQITNFTDIIFANGNGVPTPALGSTQTVTVSAANNNSKTFTVNTQGIVSRN